MNKIFKLVMAITTISTLSQAQDFHFSQFYNFGAGINPAVAGKMAEDIRATLIYRSQWRQVNSPFSTVGISADMNFIKVPAFFDRIGLGIVLLNDELPDQIFKNQYANVSLSFHKSLDAYRRHKIAVGIQPGYSIKTFNAAGRYSTADLDNNNLQQSPSGASIDPSLTSGSSFGAFALNAGLFYDFTVSEKLALGIGGSMFNITAPIESVATKSVGLYDPIRLGRRTIGTLNLAYSLSKKFTVLPALMYVYQSGSSDVNLGTALAYHLNDKKDINVYLGAWYRLNDAVIPMIGMQYKHWKGAFSYDATVSSLTDVKNDKTIRGKTVGAYEFTLTYVGFLSRAIPNQVTVPCRFF